MPDPVAEQHMRSMGVDPGVLGQPTSRPQVSREEEHEVQPSTTNPAFCRCGQPVATHPGAVQVMPRVRAEEEPPVERPHEPVNPYADALRRRKVPFGDTEITMVEDPTMEPGTFRLVNADMPARTWPDPAHEDRVLREIGSHRYEWTGRSPDTCKVTSADGSTLWCGLPEGSRVHDPSVERVPTKQRPGDQVLPTVSDRGDVQSLVIADVEERRQVGITRYGTALQPFNGRDTVLDLYEELLDATVYMRSLVEMRSLAAEEIQDVVLAALDGKVGNLGLPQEDRDRAVRGWASAVTEALADRLALLRATP